jgi:hypothetical protein
VDAVQYAVDIAAQMSGAETTFAQLDALTAKLDGGGKNAAHFQQAIQRVSGELDAARNATVAANAALAKGSEEYRALEAAALQAAKSAEKALLRGDTMAATLQARADQAAKAVDSYAVTLVGLETDATRAAKAETALGNTLANVRKLSDHTNRSLEMQGQRLSKLQGSLNTIGGPVGRLGNALVAPVKGFEELAGSMGTMGAAAIFAVAGIVLVVAAVVALSAAFVAGIVSAAAYGIKLADTARSAGLAAEAFDLVNPGVAAVRNQFAGLTRDTGLAVGELQGLAKALSDAKVATGDMPAALRAAAVAEAALGKGGSAAFVAKIKAGSLSVKQFAADTQQMEGIVARQMMGLDAQSARLKSNFAALFNGLQIEGALGGLQTLVGLFDKTEASGQSIKFLFETVFQPLIDQAQTAAYVVEAFALGFLTGLTKIYIAIKPAIKAIGELFGFEDFRLQDLLDMAAGAGEVFAVVFTAAAVVIGALAAAVGLVVIGFGVFVATCTAVGAGLIWLASIPVQGAIAAWGALRGAVSAGIDWFRALPQQFQNIGALIIQGLAGGITGSAGAVLQALSGVVSSAIAGAKKMLGIASPSKVFMGIGEFTGEGMVEGLDNTKGAVTAALGEMVEPPVSALSRQDALGGNLSAVASAPAAPAQASAPAVSNPGTVIDLRGAALSFGGAGDAPTSIERFGEMLTRVLEGDVQVLAGAT